MEELIYFCQPNKVKLPASLQIAHFGNTGYLSIANHDNGLHVALVGNAAAMVLALRQAADDLEKRLFLVEHKKRVQRAESAKDWGWLTPERVIAYFEQSPALRPHADDVRAVLKNSFTQPVSQLQQDLETIRRAGIKSGKVKKSEIARALGISAGGGANWARVTAIADHLSSSSSTNTPPIEEKKLRAAA